MQCLLNRFMREAELGEGMNIVSKDHMVVDGAVKLVKVGGWQGGNIDEEVDPLDDAKIMA